MEKKVKEYVAVFFVFLAVKFTAVSAVGSMSSLAASYGENGRTLCGLNADGSHFATCFGSDAAIVYGAPLRKAFTGLTAGDGFVCGLEGSGQPYCWGNNVYVQMGVPPSAALYVEISAGDHHLCALRKWVKDEPAVDCWGYNMTGSYLTGVRLESITAGSLFNCGLVKGNRSAVCWGDETGSGVISMVPKGFRFRSLAAGGYHVCGLLRSEPPGRAVCWGRTELSYGFDPPGALLSEIVGGKFHACGILAANRHVICWGQALPGMSPAPAGVEFLALAAGDFFTCGVTGSLQTVCWGLNYPRNSPLAIVPGTCRAGPCESGSYEYEKNLCLPPARVCVSCSKVCPDGMFESKACGPAGDRQCSYNCSVCGEESGQGCGEECGKQSGGKKKRAALGTPMIVAEMAIAVVVGVILSAMAVAWIRFRMSKPDLPEATVSIKASPAPNKKATVAQHEFKIKRAQVFKYEELERATGAFNKESEVGRGSYSVVFKGILSDNRVVAVKRAVVAAERHRTDCNEFEREVDLLSRLNHAHLLNLLGYCDQNGERLLVYEFMSHGTLHEHLHGKTKPKLSWIRRVTIAVQAARGLEYLHGYACPPVIHRDIKSSNILIDEDHNARVADFGLSLLGPADSSCPLDELPAGTLGYLDPEYYRLHYLTTKSDVYSFGVLLLEILSGRKAIDMKYEEGSGNIVEWAVPLIKSGQTGLILDPDLEPPMNYEALFRIAKVAYKCVKMQGKKRPSMDRVTTELERALALLMGTPCDEQPILPTEVVLGSSRLHRKPSGGSQDLEVRAPSWITFPSVASSQRRKSSVSEDTKNEQQEHAGSLRRVVEVKDQQEDAEICPASPQQNLFLQCNF
ncbi:hypothetical protein SUGI_0491540 [Cryptomeria japonica]|uniref:serine/threonine-protein kinase-like protein CR4 n=1 Tax=Cryptomeria japonica TaxID=3369 RepID=UPI002408970F|nr:serine/threonine-protein kinase-like protein CR4 [Cryptomeria japonica]GLJ25662.1 hypothetical protein SUGI_0491540 [Cryptomeria japonica]